MENIVKLEIYKYRFESWTIIPQYNKINVLMF